MTKRNFFLMTLFIITMVASASAQTIRWNKVKVLVYTKNGKGFIHDNIPNSVKAIQEIGKSNGFSVDTSSNPGDF